MVEEGRTGENASGLAASVAREKGGDRADRYLDEQTRLTRLQIEQIEEENATRRHILKLERASVAMKVAFELAVALIVTVVTIGLGAAIWSAANDNGLIVESFSVPPDLAGRGLTGDVIAAKLLDKLSMLQGATQSNRAPSSYANNWGNDIKLQIPDTGVSIGEFVRSLHSWLGHQTRITGEVYRTPAGLAVTARAGSAASPTFKGGDADLDKLIQQAAESVYRATQPYRYASYLSNAGRIQESEAAYGRLIANGSRTDRAWANIGIENIYANRGDYTRARQALANALALKPNFVLVYVNLAGLENNLQHDEARHAAMLKAMEIGHGPRDPEFAEVPWREGVLIGDAQLAEDDGDYQREVSLDDQLEALPEFNNQVEGARTDNIVAYAWLHDRKGMKQAEASMPPTTDAQTLLLRNFDVTAAALVLGDPAPMLAGKEKTNAFFAKIGFSGEPVLQRQLYPLEAFALALSGDLAGAHALVDTTPVDCVQCVRIRAAIDLREKNWGGAIYWCARAAHDAPSIALSWSDWGRALLRSGADDGAIAKFEHAHALGPNFADPLEMWGEALLAKHQPDQAIEKFRDANEHAPNWGRLHLNWGKALGDVGQKDEAQKQFAIAAGLDLTPDEKVELAKVRHG